jgi:hypothetical protein
MINPQYIEEILTASSQISLFPEVGDARWIEPLNGAALKDVLYYALSAISQPVTILRARDLLAFRDSGNRDVYQKPYYVRRRNLVCLAVALSREIASPGLDRIATKPLLIDAIQDLLWAICEESSWVISAHLENNGLSSALPPPDIHMIDLAAAQTALTLVEVLGITESVLHPEIVARVDYELEQRIFRPYLHRNNFHWMTARHNWNIVCHAGIGGAALYRGGRNRGAILEKVFRYAPLYIEGHDSAGCTPEGVMVWNYGFGHLCLLNELIEHFSNGELSIFAGREDKIRSIAMLPQHLHLSADQYINFSDCDVTTALASFIFFYTHRRLDIPWVSPGYGGLKEHDYILRMLFMPDDFATPRLANPGRCFFSAENQWLVVPVNHGVQPFIAAIKGGNNGESHNHNDLGTFILHSSGETFITDLGRDHFTAQTFGENRYAALPYASRGHSVPIIQQCEQPFGANFSSRIMEYHDAMSQRITLDLTAAYPTEAECAAFYRTFEVSGDDAVVQVCDYFAPRRHADVLSVEERLWSFLPIHVPVAGAQDGSFTIIGSRAAVKGSCDPVPVAMHVHHVTAAVQSRPAWCLAISYEIREPVTIHLQLRIKSTAEVTL